MSYSNFAIGYMRPPLPQLRKRSKQKNPLVPSKDQIDGTGEVVFPGPFSSAYSTVDTIPLDQATADYRQALARIRESKSNTVVIGKKMTDMPQDSTNADDFDIVPASPESSGFNSDD
ncbi:hypothetical protein H4R99_007592 [Coemansia sp. RSA 1722]|nr:hypothetical protein IWW45_008852 [Coemansia sp. RSA 485]KAJ2589065.1 hypothetical protein H4R99_007592 [Coemansia sp. RSA 1722]